MSHLISSQMRARLLANGARTASGEVHDPYPVVRLFMSGGDASWLLTELDPDDHDLAYGLCDVGLGVPAVGYVRLPDLVRLVGELLQCDASFVARQPLSAYLREASAQGTMPP